VNRSRKLARLTGEWSLGVLAAVLIMALVGCGNGGVGGDAGPTGPSPTTAPTATPGGAVPVTRGALPTAAAVVEPTRLELSTIGVSATVRPVGIDAATGELSVPPSVDTVGWYRFGPGLDATQGSVVVAGHVDIADEGKGAFFRLRELAEGDPVVVTGSDGVTRTYRVSEREAWPKTRIPLDRYFARDGAPRLTLITCGGPFDEETSSYRDNVVITAVAT
jgi:hypothetical protein